MDLWLLLLGQIVALLTICYLYINRKYSYWTKLGLKGPLPLPFFGNEWEKLFKGQVRTEIEWHQKYGKVYGTYSENSKPTLSIVDPDLVKQMMVKDFSSFVNRALFPGGGITNRMLFFLESEDWKRVRAITSPAFTSGKLRGMNPLMDKCIDKLAIYFEKACAKGGVIDTKKVISGFTIDVISTTSFGMETNANDDRSEKNVFVETATDTFKFNKFKAFLKFLTPMFVFKLMRYMARGKDEGGFYGKMSKEIVKQRRESGKKRNDFIDLLLNAYVSEEELKRSGYDSLTASADKEDESKSATNANSPANKLVKKLDDDEIIAQCMIFFIGGFETTASTIAHCLFELAQNAEIQECLNTEFRKHLHGLDPTSDEYYETVMNKLPYLDAVIKETLRKYPPLTRVERRVGVNGYKLGGVPLEKDQMVYVSVYGLHHNPEYFAQPERFNPDRFMPENLHLIVPYSYMPFGQGPRNCIGMRFALQEIKICLAKIVPQFRFSPTKQTPKRLSFVPIGLMSVEPFPLKVSKR